jgi:hypothetical protein
MRSKPKRNRKVWALINPVEHAIRGACITPQQELDKLRLRELASLDALVHGQGGLGEWQDINAANNLCQVMAEMGIGPEALETTRDVEQALIDAAGRFERTGRMGLTGPAIKAMRDMLEYHDLQRQSVPRSKYEEAIRLVTAQIKSGHTKKVSELI